MARWLALGGVGGLLAGCKPSQPYLGTRVSSHAVTVQRKRDGVIVTGSGNETKRATWRDMGNNILEAQPPGGAFTIIRFRWWVSEDGKTMTITDLQPDGGERANFTDTRQ